MADDAASLSTVCPVPTGDSWECLQIEHKTPNCGHCNALILIPQDNPFTPSRCRTCWRFRCIECEADGRCDVIERKLERWEAA